MPSVASSRITIGSSKHRPNASDMFTAKLKYSRYVIIGSSASVFCAMPMSQLMASGSTT